MSMNDYEKRYIQLVTTHERVEPPEPVKSNGNGNTLHILYKAHEKGGIEGAKAALDVLREKDPNFKNEVQPVSQWPVLTPKEMKLLPPPEWLIPNLVQERGINEIHGKPGCGKSLYTLYECARLARQNRRILYVITEGSAGFKRRIEGWEDMYGEMSENLHFCQRVVELDDPIKVEQFIDEHKRAGYDLIVFDTLSNCRSGGDENASPEIRKVTQGCQRISDELKTAILLLHHTSRSSDNPRGSNGLDAGCDVMSLVKCKDSIVTISWYKTRDFERFPTRQMKIVKTANGFTLAPCDDSDVSVEDELTLNSVERKILRILANATLPMPSKGIRFEVGAPDTSFDTALKNLKVYGFISQDEPRQPYSITEAGREALDEL